MTKEEQGPAFSTEELSKALEVCKHSSRSSLTTSGQNPGYLFWRSQRWVDVEEHFGDSKSKVLLAALEGISDDFRNLENAFLLQTRNKGDSRPAFDWRRQIVKAFGNKFPDVPSKVMSCLEADFAHRHR